MSDDVEIMTHLANLGGIEQKVVNAAIKWSRARNKEEASMSLRAAVKELLDGRKEFSKTAAAANWKRLIESNLKRTETIKLKEKK